jgi:predicted amidophosphoribosyltransferase
MTGQLSVVFPGCRKCSHFGDGPADRCWSCALSLLELPTADACPRCSQRVSAEGRCPNELCHSRQRRIGRIQAIAYQSGPLRRAINEYKYRGARDLAAVFGRLLLSWLDQNMTPDQPDLIIANPSFVGAGGQLFAHTEAVLDAAAAEARVRPDGVSWTFDTGTPRALVKTAPTLRSADEHAWSKRAAANDLRDALAVPDRLRTKGRFVLVYDDVCTTGGQLDAVAACLLDQGGAERVEGIVLARAPWRGAP